MEPLLDIPTFPIQPDEPQEIGYVEPTRALPAAAPIITTFSTSFGISGGRFGTVVLPPGTSRLPWW